MKPIFTDLSHDDWLNKCLHRQTQNQNEALNKIIWTKCPKIVFVHKNVIDMWVNSAILQFNDGLSAISNLLVYFGIQSGNVTSYISKLGDRQSVKNSENRSSDESKDKETEYEPHESYLMGAY